MQDRSLEVSRVGKLLVEFKLSKRQETGPAMKRNRVAVKLESIKTVLGFLGKNKAVLELAPNQKVD